MKKNFPLIILVFSLLLVSCSNRKAYQVTNTPEQTLELVFWCENSTYHVGEDIVAILSLKNTGKTNILVNSRMSVNLPVLSSPVREITFRITMPNGEQYKLDAFIDPRPLELEDFIEIKPGGIFETAIHLSSYFRFTEPGVYKVIANYQNLIDPTYIDPEDSRIAWKGELNSDEVQLTIVP